MSILRFRLPAVVLLEWALASCAPWTVRPIDDAKDAKAGSPTTLGPAAYVDSIWSAKLVPAILDTAVEARPLLEALAASVDGARAKYGHHVPNGPWYFLVKGEGRVVAADTRSHNGSIQVDVAPFDGKPDVAIQIGPVMRGTSLRDATGIVRFTDFVNQLQFADVGNELNSRVVKNVVAPLDLAAAEGRILSFAGTASADGGSGAAIQDLVPVRLTLEDGR